MGWFGNRTSGMTHRPVAVLHAGEAGCMSRRGSHDDAASSGGHAALQHRILICDDSAFFCERLVDALKAPGRHFDIVHDAQAALERLGSQPFDLVIADYEGIGMDGEAFLGEIHKLADHSGLIVVSGFMGQPSASTLFRLASYFGVDGVFLKPIDPIRIEAAVHRLLLPATETQAHGGSPDHLGRSRIGDPGSSVRRSLVDKSITLTYCDDVINIIETLERQGRLAPSKDDSSSPQSEVGSRDEHLDALLAAVPADGSYAEQAQAAGQITHEFRQRLAERIAPALNAYIRRPDTFPHEDLDGKKRLCEFVNSELEPLGLAVQCPNTGLPAKLKATTGHWPGKGRFHFEVYIDGQLKKPATSDTLPTLVLMDAYPPKELGTIQEIVGTKSKRPERGQP